MEDQNQQNISPQQPQPTPQTPGTSYISSAQPKLVLQPSADLVQEVKAQQAERAAAQAVETAAPQATVQSDSAFIQPGYQAQPPIAEQSIYPEPTNGPHAAYAAPTSENGVSTVAADSVPGTAPKNKNVLAVRAIAALMIAVNLQPIYSYIMNAVNGHGFTIYLVVYIGVVILAVGIFMLRELARFIYFVVAVILLLIAAVNLVKLYHDHSVTNDNTSSVASSESLSSSQQIAAAQAALKDSQRNPSLTPQERQKLDQSLENQINNLKAPAAIRDTESYISDYALLFTAIIPLVLLTRPSIKEVFH